VPKAVYRSDVYDKHATAQYSKLLKLMSGYLKYTRIAIPKQHELENFDSAENDLIENLENFKPVSYSKFTSLQ